MTIEKIEKAISSAIISAALESAKGGFGYAGIKFSISVKPFSITFANSGDGEYANKYIASNDGLQRCGFSDTCVTVIAKLLEAYLANPYQQEYRILMYENDHRCAYTFQKKDV